MTMCPLVWQARAGAAQLLAAMGARRKPMLNVKPRALIDEIAGLFKDEKMRAAFVESATKKLTKGG